MKVQVRIIIASHLSDTQHLLSVKDCKEANKMMNDSLNFVKWLLIKYPNTEVEIDAEVEYKQFKTK